MATKGDETAQPPPKRPRHVVQPQSKAAAAAAAAARVELNPADCNLDFEVGGGGLRGHALHGGGSAYCWSGARATVGVRRGGRYCFGCRVVAEQTVEMEDTDAGQRHLCRVGVSRGDDSVCGLGESGHSFGFEGTFFHQGRFFDYGPKFGVGDTIFCAVDLDSKPMAWIQFSKNGEWLGVAKYFDASAAGLGLVDAPVRPMPWESAIFPHVMLKNVVVEMQFGREDGLEPVEGCEPWTSAVGDGNAVFGPVFAVAQQGECELLMMVGLPAAGKSTWAEKWVKEHQEKRFVLLGTNLALEQMKLIGLLGKNSYDERFDRFMDRATAVFKILLDRATKIRHNYIIDRTHLNKIERIRTLSPFEKYHKTAVVVFPSPKELKCRSTKRFRETWKQVPSEIVDQLTATFVLPLSKDMPGSIEPLDEVIFVELSRDAAQRVLDNLRHSSSKHGTSVTSTSIGSVSGWQCTSGRSGYQIQSILDAPDRYPIQPLGVEGCLSTAGSQNVMQSTLNAPDKHLISAKDEPLDEDFIMFRTIDLYEEYESMDIEHKRITGLSDSGRITQAETARAWEMFKARLNMCREIRKEIRSAGGSPPPIPEWFLT